MDAPVHGFSLDFIRSMISEEAGQTCGWINELQLKSVFQPAFSLPHGSAFGFEANLRSLDPSGRPVSAPSLFGPVENFAETAMLDMLCAALHVHNFATPVLPRGLLLINLHPDVLLDFGNSTRFLSELLRHYRLPPGKLMIDIPGSALERGGLDEAIAAYREVGCLLAIDDFGLDNSNMDTIWHARPTLVKIDRTVTAQAVSDRGTRQMLPKAISLLHEMGILVLMEGIGQESEAVIALDSDADFGSGFYFGPMCDSVAACRNAPAELAHSWSAYALNALPVDAAESSARVPLTDTVLRSSNIRKFRTTSPEEIGRYREERRPFLNTLQELAGRVRSGQPLEDASEELFALPGAICCYVLDGEGVQSQPAIVSPTAPAKAGVDFNALTSTPHANWSRRDFFRRAVKEPGVVQVTRQYCSLNGYPHCVTFSIAVSAAGKPMIVCADVDWTSHAMARILPGSAPA